MAFDWKVPGSDGYTAANGLRGLCVNPNNFDDFRLLLGTRTILPFSFDGTPAWKYTLAQELPELPTGWTYQGITISGTTLFASAHSSSDHEVYAFNLTDLSPASTAKYEVHGTVKLTGATRTSIHYLPRLTKPTFYFLRYSQNQNTLIGRYSTADATIGGVVSRGSPFGSSRNSVANMTLSFGDHHFGLGFGFPASNAGKRLLFADTQRAELWILEYDASNNTTTRRVAYIGPGDSSPGISARPLALNVPCYDGSRYFWVEIGVGTNSARRYRLKTAPSSFSSQPITTLTLPTLTVPPANTGQGLDPCNWQKTGSTSTTHTFTSLKLNTDYTLKVRGINAQGTGEPAELDSKTLSTITVTITPRTASLRDGASTVVDIVFSSAVTDFSLADLTASAGTLSSFAGTGTTYTVTFVAPEVGAGTATLTLASSGVTGVTTDVIANITYAQSIPVLTITADNVHLAPNQQTQIYFTLSRAYSPFSAEDIVASAGTLTNFRMTSSTVYTATYTAPATGVASAMITAAPRLGVGWGRRWGRAWGGRAQFGATVTLTISFGALTSVTITPAANSVDIGGTIQLILTFSRPVTGLSLSDLSVDCGTLSNLRGSGTTYTVTLTAPTGIRFDVPANSVVEGNTPANITIPLTLPSASTLSIRKHWSTGAVSSRYV